MTRTEVYNFGDEVVVASHGVVRVYAQEGKWVTLVDGRRIFIKDIGVEYGGKIGNTSTRVNAVNPDKEIDLKLKTKVIRERLLDFPQEFHENVKSIIVSDDDGKSFVAGEKEFREGAHWNAKSGEIRVFIADKQSDDYLQNRLIPHELGHSFDSKVFDEQHYSNLSDYKDKEQVGWEHFFHQVEYKKDVPVILKPGKNARFPEGGKFTQYIEGKNDHWYQIYHGISNDDDIQIKSGLRLLKEREPENYASTQKLYDNWKNVPNATDDEKHAFALERAKGDFFSATMKEGATTDYGKAWAKDGNVRENFAEVTADMFSRKKAFESMEVERVNTFPGQFKPTKWTWKNSALTQQYPKSVESWAKIMKLGGMGKYIGDES